MHVFFFIFGTIEKHYQKPVIKIYRNLPLQAIRIIMIKYLRTAFLVVSVWCLHIQVQAQETKIYTDPYRSYKTGMELFEAKKYSTAQMQFEQTIQMIPDDASEEIIMYKADSWYYNALCAIELSNPDAEQLMLAFIENYPGHALMGSAYFNLGKIYFKNREYTKALQWYELVDEYDLNFSDRDAYKFQYAYTLFTKKKLDKANDLFKQLKEKEGPYYFASNYYYGFISYLNDDYNEAIASFNRVKDEGVYALVVPYYFCNIYYSQKEYDKLIAYAEPLIENTRLNYHAEINQLLGQAYLMKENYEKALPYLSYYVEKVRSRKPEDYYQLGFVQYQLKDYQGALSNLGSITDKNDTIYQQAAFLMGNCYVNTDKKEDARNKFLDASLYSIDKNVQQTALFNYAKLSYELQYYPAAVTSLKTYLENYPNGKFTTDAQELLADALVNTKKYDEALAILNGIPEKSKQLKIAYQKVAYYSGVDDYNNKDYVGAEDMFMKSLMYPLDGKIQAGSYFWLGEINYQDGKYAKAISNHVKYQDVAKASGNPTAEVRIAYSNYTIGYAYFRQSNFGNAVKYFDKVTNELKLSKTASQEVDIALDATLRSADCYFMTKEYNKAEKNYSKIIDNNYKGSDYALFQKGMLHGLKGENANKISTLKQLNSKFPKSLYVDDAMYEIANTYFLMKDNNAAINGFKALLNDKPNSGYVIKAYLKLGLIYYNMDDLAMAEKIL
ncbi:MAG: tetratricopeptide repeat protein [Bacteroidetes bacterium]|nr:tetratricopeptide repeat protein [Bacteroidota bacterium]